MDMSGAAQDGVHPLMWRFLVVDDPDLAGQLRDSLQRAMDNGAREVLPEELTRLSWPARLGRWLSYGLVRMMVGIAGYGARHWQAEDRIDPKPEG